MNFSPVTASSGRNSALDALRGVAVIMVVVGHFNGWAWPGWEWVVAVGVHGVDVFFVLSGFLIGRIMLDEKNSPNLLKVFYVRRACRILPAYALLLASYFAAVALDRMTRFGLIYDLYMPPGNTWSYFVLLQNNAMVSIQAMAPAWLMVTWSLAVEFQFYLLAPWIVRRCQARTLAVLGGLALLACPCLRHVFAEQGQTLSAGLLLICRADSLCAGILVALWLRQRPTPGNLRWLGPAALGAIFVTVIVTALTGSTIVTSDRHFVDVWQPTLWALSSALVVADLARRQTHWLVWPWLLWTGRVSYFVYLFHVPAYLVATVLAQKGYSPLLLAVAAQAVVLLLAALFWRRVEQPLLQYGRTRWAY